MTENQSVPAGEAATHPQRCSDGARERGDRLAGTAPPARHWFLLEQAGNWGPSAWEGLDLDDHAKEDLEDLLEDAHARLMLIRRPVPDHAVGRTGAHTGPRRWCVIQSQANSEPRVVWGTAETTEDILAAARLFGGEASRRAFGAPQPSGVAAGASQPSGPEIVLVCTHGRKDVCCAVRGRPVAAEAARLWPEATWECTHTGGDRFAGNLIILPDGACYGGLDPEDVEPIVTSHVQGRVDPAHLRGPSGYGNHVQAAMVDAYARFAPLAFHAVRPVSMTGSADGWHVHLAVDGIGAVEVTGHNETTEPEFLTCKAGVRKVMHLPIVDTVHVNGEPTDLTAPRPDETPT